METPLYSSKVQAGFPSSADEHIEAKLDLNKFLIPRPAATFMVRVSGDSMIGAGINENDILIVDRSVDAIDNKIVIAAIDNELTVKRLRYRDGKAYLFPENEAYQEIELRDGSSIWGVVTSVIRKL